MVARQTTFGWWWLSFPVEELLKGWIGGSQLVPCNRWLWGNLFLLSIVPNLSTKWRRLLRQTTWQEGPYLVISIVGSQHCDDLPYRKGDFSNYICTCECLNQTQAARFWKIGEKLPCSQLFESSTSIGSFAWIAAPKKWTKLLQLFGKPKGFPCAGEKWGSINTLVVLGSESLSNECRRWLKLKVRRSLICHPISSPLFFWMTKGGWVGFGSQVCGYYVPICFSHLGKIQNHFATGLRPRIPPTYPEASYLQ